jgi:uncharacterized protein (TIGR03435 family)
MIPLTRIRIAFAIVGIFICGGEPIVCAFKWAVEGLWRDNMSDYRRLLFVAASLIASVSIQVYAQASNSLRGFEVAIVRRADPHSGGRQPSILGGPGTHNPGQFIATNARLKDLLLTAFGLKAYQLYGPPWLALESYDITAKVPPDTSKKDFQLMQQSLLVQSFKLKYHMQERVITGLALLVDKGGAKIKDVSSETVAGGVAHEITPESSSPTVIGKNGLLVVPPGETRVSWYKGGVQARIIAANAPMERIVAVLSRLLKMEVIDQTGMSGKYTFRVDFLRMDRDVNNLHISTVTLWISISN